MDEVNVLVVDDSAFMRNLISKIIESTPGLCVIGKAINGKFALEKIPLIKPDIIVLDIEMPEMNGIEFLKQRKLQNIDIPVIVLSAVALFFICPVISIPLIVAGFLLAILQFGMYKKIVDWVFPQKTGHNVTAIKSCSGEVKRRILFNGHPDACWEWPVNYRLGGVFFEGHIVVATLGAFYYLVISILYIANYGVTFGLVDTNSTFFKMALWGLLFVPFMIGMFFMWNEKRVVDGANDNLSGCYMGIAILKALKDNNIEFAAASGYIPATDGLNLKLTIDYNVQQLCETAMEQAMDLHKAKSAQIVVLDPNTGAVRGLCCKPSFNLNEVPFSAPKNENFISLLISLLEDKEGNKVNLVNKEELKDWALVKP